MHSAFDGANRMSKDYDMIITCKDGMKLHVHSLIMTKWSAVFDSMPGNSDVGNNDKTSCLCVEEESSAWVELLGFLYPISPVSVLDWDNVDRVFTLADKYNMPGVLERCEAFLMSVNNVLSCYSGDSSYVLKWLAFAAKHNQANLREKCMQFVRLGYRKIDELRFPEEDGYLKAELVKLPAGVDCVIDILSFVIQQRR